jgi:DegV family protein with EDD domain
MTVAIVTDSGSDLSPQELVEAGIYQVPLSVTFGERTVLVPDEMAPAEFWLQLELPDSPFAHTAAPSVGLFKQAFESALASGHESIVCVCLSEKLSATLKHARMAREMLPDQDIRVVDSKAASMGIGALALRGARMSAQGSRADEIEAEMVRVSGFLDLMVGLETLEYLRKGGRISHAKAAIGGLLSVKPIIRVEDGEVNVADQPRTRSKAVERVIEMLTVQPVKELHVLYSPPVDPEAFRDAVLARMPGPAPSIVSIHVVGPVIGAHVGPGAYGGVLVRA